MHAKTKETTNETRLNAKTLVSFKLYPKKAGRGTKQKLIVHQGIMNLTDIASDTHGPSVETNSWQVAQSRNTIGERNKGQHN